MILKLSSPVSRIAFLALLIVLLCGIGWFVITAAIGDSLMTAADLLPQINQAERLRTADTAARFAASDSSVYLRRGMVYRVAAADNLTPSEINAKYLATAVESLEQAARMQPADYRIWLSLGRTLEMSEQYGLILPGNVTSSGQALERAIELAPQHFDPRWLLGNQLLRAGKTDEALSNLRVSLTNRPQAVPLIFNSVWDALQGDTATVMRLLNPPLQARAQIARLLVARKKAGEALTVWKDAIKSPEETRLMIETLLNNHFYKAAFEIWKESGQEPVQTPDAGSLMASGNFDEEINFDSKTPFLTWRITSRSGVYLSLDSAQKRTGKHSLHIVFDTKESAAFEIASQLVTLMPSTKYQLSFSVMTQDLKSFRLPSIQVYDPGDSARMAVTWPEPEITTDGWREVKLQFTTSAQTEAVVIRLTRFVCGESPCPLSGKLWLDDFQLSLAGN
jgi:Flp pilus assembly protein TadD